MSHIIKRELDGSDVFVLHNFCSSEECAQYIRRSEAIGYEEAAITTPLGFIMNKRVRDNARVMIDDPILAARLWARARPLLPQSLGAWEMVGFNERFRYYRYGVGEKFAPHYDGHFGRPNGERSQLTFMVYLNEVADGGETRFYHPNALLRLSVRPEPGMALVFVHRQLHEGAAVRRGRKYVLRTDVMYRPVDTLRKSGAELAIGESS